jgi:hypothetical protein
MRLLRGKMRSMPRPCLHELVDAEVLAVDVLHVQPPSDDLTVMDLEDRHPSYVERLPIAEGA